MKYDARDEEQQQQQQHIDPEVLEEIALMNAMDDVSAAHLEACEECRAIHEDFVLDRALFAARAAVTDKQSAPFLDPELLTTARADEEKTRQPILARVMPVLVAAAACAAVFTMNVSSISRLSPTEMTPKGPAALHGSGPSQSSLSSSASSSSSSSPSSSPATSGEMSREISWSQIQAVVAASAPASEPSHNSDLTCEQIFSQLASSSSGSIVCETTHQDHPLYAATTTTATTSPTVPATIGESETACDGEDGTQSEETRKWCGR